MSKNKKDKKPKQEEDPYVTLKLMQARAAVEIPIVPLDAERLLRCLGCARKLRGFPYTVYMVERLKEDPDAIHLITKRLYRDTACQFGVSDMAVERNVRTLVRRCWASQDHTLLEHIAGCSLCSCPTNSEFLDMMADFLRKVA